jgi:hypothetical protein
MVSATSRTGDAMDWYLIGRILGVVYWPLLVAVAVYGIGWGIAISRPPHVAPGIKRWARLAAFTGFAAMLAVTGQQLLK